MDERVGVSHALGSARCCVCGGTSFVPRRGHYTLLAKRVQRSIMREFDERDLSSHEESFNESRYFI
jgi:hypothetical protein